MANKEKGPFKYHTVFRGRQIGIYSNWGKAKESIIRFPNSSNKGFNNLQSAIEAMKDVGISNPIFFGKCPPEAKSVKIDEESHLLLSQSYNSSQEELSHSNISVWPRPLDCRPQPNATQQDQTDFNSQNLDSSDGEIFMKEIFTENISTSSDPISENLSDSETTLLKFVDTSLNLTSSTLNDHNLTNSIQRENVTKASSKNKSGDRNDEERNATNVDLLTNTNMVTGILQQVLMNQNEIKIQNEQYQEKQASDMKKTLENIEFLREENRVLTSTLNDTKAKLETLEQNDKILYEKLELSCNDKSHWQNLYNQIAVKYEELVNVLRHSEMQIKEMTLKLDKQDKVTCICKDNIAKLKNERACSYQALTPEQHETELKTPIHSSTGNKQHETELKTPIHSSTGNKQHETEQKTPIHSSTVSSSYEGKQSPSFEKDSQDHRYI